VGKLLDRKPARLVTVAMANKTARIVWAVLTRGEPIAHRSQPNTNRCPQRGRSNCMGANGNDDDDLNAAASAGTPRGAVGASSSMD